MQTKSLLCSFVASLIAVAVAACGGEVATVPDPEPAPLPDPGPGDRGEPLPEPGPAKPAPVAPVPPAPVAKTLPASQLPAAGSCSTRTATGFAVGGGDSPCIVATETKTPEGWTEIVKVTGDLGKGSVEDGALVLRCGTSDRNYMEIAVRCMQGSGDYEVPAGDLLLGGKPSDRACRVSVDIDSSRVRGFIDCPRTENDPDNVFSNSDAPIGLGHFDLPRAK